jgi:hypothetical protein
MGSLSSERNDVNKSSALTMHRFPSRCVSTQKSNPRLFKIDTATGQIWQFQTSSDGKTEIDGWLDVSDDFDTAIWKFARSQANATPSPSTEP